MSQAPAYCPFYCEENIWQLCADERGRLAGGGERRVLIISNPARRVAMWGQRTSPDPTLPVAWDYHVIMLVERPEGWEAWDLDAAGPTPRPAAQWLEDSFHGIGLLPPEFAPRFRMVTCADYRRYLRSDRRHMRGPEGNSILRRLPAQSPHPPAGDWVQPPPSWPPIMGELPPGTHDDGSNLDRFLDSEDSEFIGELLDLPGLRRWLAQSGAVDRA
ncbi:hypothetical protein DB30_07053 [Enhygromyxa salina]|uniref:Protein N-terminal glutamine amidohydrolase n=1 Tax=Enhygromyxa salina TaxID=215803 RepID=A0A0C2CX69_9BACT|nr:hypothetical protein [Enhygromyxa salina]KIG14195.1 hypothetical protein DB30_07053 [Enhygromyxa salina]